jgi:hypothetical protein
MQGGKKIKHILVLVYSSIRICSSLRTFYFLKGVIWLGLGLGLGLGVGLD